MASAIPSCAFRILVAAADILALPSSGNLVAVAVLIVFVFPLPLPLCKFPLSFFTLIESEDVREDAARDLLDFMLRDAGIVNELLSPTQDSPPSYADG